MWGRCVEGKRERVGKDTHTPHTTYLVEVISYTIYVTFTLGDGVLTRETLVDLVLSFSELSIVHWSHSYCYSHCLLTSIEVWLACYVGWHSFVHSRRLYATIWGSTVWSAILTDTFGDGWKTMVEEVKVVTSPLLIIFYVYNEFTLYDSAAFYPFSRSIFRVSVFLVRPCDSITSFFP